MPLRDDLLTPIPGDNPGGVDLRYDPLYDKIKEARREDDDAPQGEWATTRKLADWPQVIKLTQDALATRTKDLQLAAWLTEALLRKDGYGGLRDGLALLHGLLDTLWDHLYPEIDEDDYEMRAAPLEWVGRKLDAPVNLVPLVRAAPYGVMKYREARAVGYEVADEYDVAGREARASAIAEGKLTAEDWDRAFDATPKQWYKTLVADLADALEQLAALDAIATDKFGPDAPSFGPLKDALKDVQRTAQQLLQQKLEKDPDPVEVAGTALVAADGGAVDAGGPDGAAGGALAPEPGSREDAASRIAVVARWLRRSEPFSPAAYLMLRGFRWGELRAGGAEPDPRLLEAPPTALRRQLKSLLLDAKWGELLEASETVMGTAYGRGWLDLQRYALSACDGLGADYTAVQAALLGALRSLLADVPTLPDLTLMDDTPTANAETRAWLRSAVLPGMAADAAAAVAVGPADAPLGVRAPARNGRDPYPRALAEARAGRPERGVELISGALATEKSRRGRFVRQTQMAGVMLAGGLEQLARPLLEDLVGQVDALKLDEWEDAGLAARPLGLLWRCLDRMGADDEAKQHLYLRVARLDPLAAIALRPGADAPAGDAWAAPSDSWSSGDWAASEEASVDAAAAEE